MHHCEISFQNLCYARSTYLRQKWAQLTQIFEKTLNITYLSPDKNLTKCTIVKKKNSLFNSDDLVMKRGYKHNCKTNKQNFRKKLHKSGGRSNY